MNEMSRFARFRNSKKKDSANPIQRTFSLAHPLHSVGIFFSFLEIVLVGGVKNFRLRFYAFSEFAS